MTVELSPPDTGLSSWVLAALAFQLAVLALFSGIAVRIVNQPLARLAEAADQLGPELRGAVLDEGGPKEVSRAAVAFNAMQRRIADHFTERVRILAAIFHHLQSSDHADAPATPTCSTTSTLKQKLQNDPAAMQALIEEGIDLARSAERATETPIATDIQALLESLVYDYADSGKQVGLIGRVDAPVITSPRTLARHHQSGGQRAQVRLRGRNRGGAGDAGSGHHRGPRQRPGDPGIRTWRRAGAILSR